MKNLDIVLYVKEYSLEELDETDRRLVDEAVRMTDNSYAPYSRFNVGAAIMLADGTIVTGSNQENAAFPSGTCAERSACFNAGANHPGVAFKTIAIAARDADSKTLTENPISPCGACRQALLEYEKLSGSDVKVLLAAADKVLVVPSVKSLLPFAFLKF